MLRQWINNVLDEYGDVFPEILPLEVRRRLQLIDRRTAIKEIHCPASDSHCKAARKRLAFDEFFLLELGLELKKKRWQIEEQGISFKVESQLLDRFISGLPFQLTEAQKRVFETIKADMENTQPMNRLLQGDVGSGKTVVAAMTLLCAIQSGYQGALMVPTEVLAEQHAYNFSELLKPIGLNVVLLKGDLTKGGRETVLADIADGSAHVVVGTHALIQEGVDFSPARSCDYRRTASIWCHAARNTSGQRRDAGCSSNDGDTDSTYTCADGLWRPECLGD